MTRFRILVFIVAIAPALAFGQEVFQRSYGGSGGDYGRAVIECSTGGYAIVGSTNSFQTAGTDIYLLRVDEAGDYIWGKSIGEPNKISWGMDIAEDDEGNFLIAGYTNNSPSESYDGFLMKTNYSGDVLWQKTYGGDDWDFIENMAVTDNGEIILAGQKTVSGHQQGWILKADNAGEVIWEKLLESSGQLKITGLDVCDNGSIVFTGNTSNLLLGTQTFVTGNLNQSGNIVWVSSYPEFGKVETGKCVCGNGNNLFTVSTRYYDDDTNDILINSINTQSGAVNWVRYVGDSHGIGKGIMQKANGEIFFSGTRDGYGFNSYSGSINVYTEFGEEIPDGHTAIVGGFGYDVLNDIIPTIDGGHIAVGETNSFGNGFQMHLCKIDSNGTYAITNIDFIDFATSIYSPETPQELKIHPNPATDRIYPGSNFTKNTTYRILTLSGKEVAIGKIKNLGKAEIDISRLESGMYILTFYESKIAIGSTRFIKLP